MFEKGCFDFLELKFNSQFYRAISIYQHILRVISRTKSFYGHINLSVFSFCIYLYFYHLKMKSIILLGLFFALSLGQNTRQSIFNDSLTLWEMYRDPITGVYCDHVQFHSSKPCGAGNNFYSSAGTGMGLVIKSIMVEYGYNSYSQAESEATQTLKNITNCWPKDSHTGFLVHFTNRKWQATSEFSTIDSAELVLGALFAGNYFGGEVLQLANSLKNSIAWSAAIKSASNPTIYPVVDPNTGVMSGDIRPYNEYYLVAYLAYLTSCSENSKAVQYFETYMETNGSEPIGDGHYPVHKFYHQYDLLTDNPNKFMSSFIPQFCYFLSKHFQSNSFYSTQMLPAWFQSDKLFWSFAIPHDETVWGVPVAGRVFGAGAGPGVSGYSVERIDGSPDLIVSAAIMAGFLPAANQTEKALINEQLDWLYENTICAYPLNFEGRNVKVLWRCSVAESEWRCPSVDSIDYSTFTLGYATNFLPSNFFSKYAV